MKKQQPINIFDYFDYREYLSDYYKYLKKKRIGYSFRLFSIEADISSHNFLPRIISRQRTLSQRFLPKLAKYFDLSQKEEHYFNTLIEFNNATHPSIKEKYLKQLLTFRVTSEEYRIEDTKLQFFDKWYYPIIRELAVICDFQDDYGVLAKNCVPRITAAQAKNAVSFLLNNGFIQRQENGTYLSSNAIIATDREVDSVIIPKYHKATLQQCADAVEAIKKEDRNISSSTVSISKKMYEEFKEEIYHFRKKLLSMAKECQDPDMVYFVGIQLLPRSELIKKQATPINDNTGKDQSL